MSVAIKLPNNLIEEAKLHANICNRSVPKQIEYWLRIGKIAEENPDMPYSFIKNILLGLEELRHNKVEEYKFNKK